MPALFLHPASLVGLPLVCCQTRPVNLGDGVRECLAWGVGGRDWDFHSPTLPQVCATAAPLTLFLEVGLIPREGRQPRPIRKSPTARYHLSIPPLLMLHYSQGAEQAWNTGSEPRLEGGT